MASVLNCLRYRTGSCAQSSRPHGTTNLGLHQALARGVIRRFVATVRAYDNYAGSARSYSGRYEQQDDSEYQVTDPVGTWVKVANESMSSTTRWLVARITDALLVVVPAQAPRIAVERSVQGGLLLLGLALLRNVLGLILAVGCMLLGLYIANQVLNWQIPGFINPPSNDPSTSDTGTGYKSTRSPRPGPRSYADGQRQARASGGYGPKGYANWSSAEQARRGRPTSSSGYPPSWTWAATSSSPASDVVDVKFD